MTTRGEEGLCIVRSGNVSVSDRPAIFSASARLYRHRDLPGPADLGLDPEREFGGVTCTTAKYGEGSRQTFNQDPCFPFRPTVTDL